MLGRVNYDHPVVRRSVPAEVYDQVVSLADVTRDWEGYIVYQRNGEWFRHHEECGRQWGEARELAYRLRDRGAEQVFLVSCIRAGRLSVEVLVEEYDRPARAERGFDKLLPSRRSSLAA